ncbi:PAS domain-containing sensor histidine kinase [Piscinibacter defluvii]|uniref:PAS domain-containing sensor histidine kinase n=1 Tax=Piscinibacter defluvii TaxID=1796922 RepID=UPI000FDD5D4A|nr:PAS domain-containing protein [Piscinibacter defluvii]
MEFDFANLAAAQSPVALVATTPDGVVQWWNPAAERLFGYAADEALGRSLRALIVPPEQAEDDAALQREALAGGGERHEVLRRRKDGVPIYVDTRLHPLRGHDGRPAGLLGHLSDATRHRAQRDADMVQARFGGVLEHAPDAVVIVNGTGRIVLFNEQARTLFGHRSEAVIGEPIECLLPPRLRGPHLAQRMGYLVAPRMRPMGEGRELHGLRADGVEFPVEISLSPIDSPGGRLVMSAIRDISERRRFERTLQEKNLELERASRAKDRFLATMSHELRTPLNAVIGFTGLLLMKLPGPLTPEQEKQLKLVQASGKHLLSLINDLLDLARIESGKVELHREPVACAALLDEVLQTLRPAAQAKGLRLEAGPVDGRLELNTDRRALQQVLINLANNAVKFTVVGSVTLSVTRVNEGDAAQVEFGVADTGIGISAEDCARLFQAFAQVGDPRRRQGEGTGLGLHLSHRLAELMGGRILVESEPGVGSRFALRLPEA